MFSCLYDHTLDSYFLIPLEGFDVKFSVIWEEYNSYMIEIDYDLRIN